MRVTLILLLLLTYQLLFPQAKAFESFVSDSVMKHGFVSFHIIDSENGTTLFDHNSGKNLVPASVMKLVTTAAAIELLGPDHTFTTAIGYNGHLNRRSGVLKGNIIVKGGGDPALGSQEFGDFYAGFEGKLAGEILKTGIRKIKGRVVTDDSYFDYQPVPGKWLWEDIGNYYGAGAYGVSVYDNTCRIHFRTSSGGSDHSVTGIFPEEYRPELNDMLMVSGTTDEGYVYAAPYSAWGWMAGSIPSGQEDFVLKASITDPPLVMAAIINKRLKDSGIKITGEPSTVRYEPGSADGFTVISEIISPSLKEIIEVLNHESVNLYAEHLVKEIGKRFKNSGSTDSGIVVIDEFLAGQGITTGALFMEDGSGLSPKNSVNARTMTDLLVYMKNESRHAEEFVNSLPAAAKEGTLRNHFRDPVFETRMRAKSGSMTRVRGYAGYLQSVSGKELVFCIIVNNFTGRSGIIVRHIENILAETILSN